MRTKLLIECGVNHQGDLNTALRMIDMAKEVGGDFVKLQKRQPELHVQPALRDTLRDTPFGPMTHWDYRHRIEFGRREYDAIARHCERVGLPWSVSVWDEPSVDFMQPYDVPWLKIPSAMVVHHGLLDHTAATGVPLVVSTGMSTEAEVDAAVAHVPAVPGASVLVCNSSYPTEDAGINLRQLDTYRARYPAFPIGFSSHSASPYPALYAAVLGARTVEVHATLDRTWVGSDHRSSLEPKGLALLAREFERIEVVLGDGVKRVDEGEAVARRRLRGS